MDIGSLDAVKYSHARSGTPRFSRGLRLRFRVICFVYCERLCENASWNRMRMLGIPTKPCAARVAAALGKPESGDPNRFGQFSLVCMRLTRTFCKPARFLSLYPKRVAKAASPVAAAYPIGERSRAAGSIGRQRYGKDHGWHRKVACVHEPQRLAAMKHVGLPESDAV
ncbi:hypothetical protein [Paraburkholderia sediminicola]|uniref:hypothetical protein n=1 Tax=Paraburkholderia sediminicola TaxID=458836 RepID=UPI0038BAB79A